MSSKDPDDFFQALEILNGLTENCQECGRPISDDMCVVNWGSCDLCFDAAYDEYYQSELAKAQREWEAQEYARLREYGEF